VAERGDASVEIGRTVGTVVGDDCIVQLDRTVNASGISKCIPSTAGVVADERAVVDRHRPHPDGHGAAPGVIALNTYHDALIIVDENRDPECPVVGERAVADRHRAVEVFDGAAAGVAAAVKGGVPREGAAADRQRSGVPNGAAAAGEAIVAGCVVGEGTVADGEYCGIEYGAAGFVVTAVGNRQVADCHVARAAADPEDAPLIVTADGQSIGAGALNVQALVDPEIVACQGDGLARETGREADGVAGLCGGDLRSQRADPAVGSGADGQRAEQAAGLEGLQLKWRCGCEKSHDRTSV
jgi:hypothetical protein